MKLKNKIAIITGARRGLGLEVAKLFLKEGATVIGVAQHEMKKATYIKELMKSDKFIFEKVDITDVSAVKKLASKVDKQFGKLDILVNNAGINSVGNIEETTVDDFNWTIKVNIFGTFIVTKYMIPLLKRSLGSGTIVNVSSNIGLMGMAGRIAYTTSKGAILNFTRSMALDYAGQNIRVNSIAPGAINTDMVIDYLDQCSEEFKEDLYRKHALNRLAEPEEIARGILFLASDDSSYMTGSILSMDGGYTCGK